MMNLSEYVRFSDSNLFTGLCVIVGVLVVLLLVLLFGRRRRRTSLTFVIFLLWAAVYACLLGSSGL